MPVVRANLTPHPLAERLVTLIGAIYLNKIIISGLPAPAAKYYLEATRLSFRYRGAERNIRADLISFRYTALMYRSLGQKSRTLQLLARCVSIIFNVKSVNYFLTKIFCVYWLVCLFALGVNEYVF